MVTDIHQRFVAASRVQKNEAAISNILSCPYCVGRLFQDIDHLFDHVMDKHESSVKGLEPGQARRIVREAALNSMQSTVPDATLSVYGLSLEHTNPRAGKKRPAASALLPSCKRAPPPAHPSVSPKPIRLRSSEALSGHFESGEYVVQLDVKSSRTSPATSNRAPKPAAPSSTQCQPSPLDLQNVGQRCPGLLLQPDSRPISQEQLASEVKSLYAGLTMVETKCIHVDRAQAAAVRDVNSMQKLPSDQWQALIALHRTLLHEHHDFFLASQHPSASTTMKRLVAKHSMPARMWKHGIHSFLELLRRQMPDSLDYMLAFIYLAYQMMAQLQDTVPHLQDTWIECLGDLGRYRMAIEDKDIRGRDTWAGVARSWYGKAHHRPEEPQPKAGHPFYSLTPFGDPKTLQQLYYYWQLFPNTTVSAEAKTSAARPVDQDPELSWWQTVKQQVYFTIERLQQGLRGLADQRSNAFRLITVSLKHHKSIVATILCAAGVPVAIAADYDPVLIADRAPIFGSLAPIDYAMLALMVFYLSTTSLVRVRTTWKNVHSFTFSLSFAIMTSMGLLSIIVSRDDFAASMRKIVLEAWFTCTLHVGAQYCYDNYSPSNFKMHILAFLSLSTILGLVLKGFPSINLLDALPPYTAVVALIALIAHERVKPAPPRQRQHDEEYGAYALDDFASHTSPNPDLHHQQHGVIIPSAELPHHDSIPPPDTRRSTTVSTSSDNIFELASLRSDSPGNPRVD